MDEIIKKCKCGIFLSINENRDVYQSVEDKIKEVNDWDFSNNGHHEDYEPEIDKETADRMIKENQFYELRFYPNTPIGFYIVYGTSFDEVIKKALAILNE